MNNLSRIITGTALILFGLWFCLFVGFIDGPKLDVGRIIFGGLFVLLGLFIFFNKKEDEIEQINLRGGKSK